MEKRGTPETTRNARMLKFLGNILISCTASLRMSLIGSEGESERR